MSLRVRWFVAAMLFMAAAPAAFSAEPQSFRDTLQRLADARSQIKSYELNVIAVVDYKLKEIEVADGSTFVVERKPVSFILQLVFDRNSDRLLVAREDSFVVVKTGERVTDDWKAFVSTPLWDLVRDNGNQKGMIFNHEARNRSRCPVYFDPLMLGLLVGFQTRSTVDNTISDYAVRADGFRLVEAADDKFRYVVGPEKSQDQVIDIDAQRDYWPIAMEFHPGGRGGMSSTLQLDKIHDHWLPASGTMKFRDQQVDLKLDWLSVNKPVETRFAEQDISQRYRFTILDQRK